MINAKLELLIEQNEFEFQQTEEYGVRKVQEEFLRAIEKERQHLKNIIVRANKGKDFFAKFTR